MRESERTGFVDGSRELIHAFVGSHVLEIFVRERLSAVEFLGDRETGEECNLFLETELVENTGNCLISCMSASSSNIGSSSATLLVEEESRERGDGSTYPSELTECRPSDGDLVASSGLMVVFGFLVVIVERERWVARF